MIGSIIITWAMIIIIGVYKIFIKPKKPDWEKRIYKTKPTNTGGKAIIELKKIKTTFLPKKLFDARMPAIGSPIIVETNKATKETFSERNIISYRFLSNDKIKDKELKKTSTQVKKFFSVLL